MKIRDLFKPKVVMEYGVRSSGEVVYLGDLTVPALLSYAGLKTRVIELFNSRPGTDYDLLRTPKGMWTSSRYRSRAMRHLAKLYDNSHQERIEVARIRFAENLDRLCADPLIWIECTDPYELLVAKRFGLYVTPQGYAIKEIWRA
jgi:hypothetical protein